MTTPSVQEYVGGTLIIAGMLLLIAVAVVDIRINLRRRPFNYKALTAAGSIGLTVFTLGMVILIWSEFVVLTLALVGLAACETLFAFVYSRRLSRRYGEEGLR